MDYNDIDPAIGEKPNLTLCYAVDPSEFYCHVSKKCDDINSMSETLNEAYCALSDDELCLVPRGSSRGNVHVGQFCCSKFSQDDYWYRARISTLYNLESVELYFIDYGNAERTQISQLKILKPEFAHLPPQAIKCSLSDIEPVANKWSDEYTQYFASLVEGKELNVTIINKLNDCFKVNLQLVENNADVAEELLKLGFGRRLSNQSIASPQIYASADEKLAEGSTHNAFVPWIENLGEFSVIIVDNDYELFKQMTTKMQQHYGPLQQNKDQLSSTFVGQPCVAKFQLDSIWYRAEIFELSASTAKVLFVDYGNQEVVSLDQIKSIHPEYLKLPKLWLPCKFRSIKPLRASTWPPHDKKTVNKYFDYQFACKFHKRLPCGRYAVDLINKINGKNVAEQMVNDRLAEYIDTPPSTATNKVVQQAKIDDFPVEIISSQQNVNVVVSHVDSVGCFWCQLEEELASLDQLMEEIAAKVDAKTSSNSMFASQQFCLAQYSADDGWYRAKISSVDGKNYTVLFVDYGNAEVVPESRLKSIDSCLCSLPAFAFLCSLEGVSNVLNKEVSTYFESLVYDKVLTFSAVKWMSTLGILSGSVNEADTNLNLLISSKFPQSSAPKNSVIHSSLPSDTLEPIQIIYGSSPLSFFVCAIQDCDRRDQLFEEMQNADEYISAPIDGINIGDYYTVKYSEDENWYRSIITSILGTEITVYFIDYGNSETVNVSNIKILPDTFYTYPAFAIHCSLNGNFTESTQLVEKFEEFTFSAETMKAKLLNVIGDKHLISLILDDDVDVAAELQSPAVKEDSATNVDGTVSSLSIENSTLNCGILEPVSAQLPHLQAKVIDQPIKSAAKDVESTKLSLPVRMVLRPEVNMPVQIIYGSSPTSFFVCASIDLDQRDQLFEKMQNVEDYKMASIADIKVNEYYAVKYSEDENWYRSVVTNIQEENIDVYFVDYGNSENVNISNVRIMNPVFYSYPVYASHCSLSGDISDNKESVAKFKKLTFSAEEMTAKLVKVVDNKHIISLIIDGKIDVSAECEKVKENVEVPIEEAIEECNSVNDEISGELMQDDNIINPAKDNVHTVNEVTESNSAKDEDYDDAFQDDKIEIVQGNVPEEVLDNGKTESALSEEISIEPSKISDSSIPTIRIDEAPKEDDIPEIDADVECSNPHTTVETTIRDKDDKVAESCDSTVINETNQDADMEVVECPSLNTNDEVTIKDEDLKVVECCTSTDIDEVNQDDDIKIVGEVVLCPSPPTYDKATNPDDNLDSPAIDEVTIKDNEETVDCNNETSISNISVEIVDFAKCDDPLAFEEPPVQDNIEKFAETMECDEALSTDVDKSVEIVALMECSTPLAADECHTYVKGSETCADEICAQNEGGKLTTNEIEKARNADTYSTIDIIPNQTLRATVSYALNPSHFYVQICTEQNNMKHITGTLNGHYGESPAPISCNWAVGTPCVAQLSKDGAWYRGTIADYDASSETANVLFIDYGNSKLTDCNKIYEVTADMLKLPAQAVSCQLNKSGEGEWTEDEVEKFMEAVEDTDKQYEVEFLAKNLNGRWLIHLKDDNSNIEEVIENLSKVSVTPSMYSSKNDGKIVPGSVTYTNGNDAVVVDEDKSVETSI